MMSPLSSDVLVFRKDVPCPTTVVKYNNNMGGVDLSDQLMSYYTMSCRTQRWWLKLTFNLLENAVVNVYILAKKFLALIALLNSLSESS